MKAAFLSRPSAFVPVVMSAITMAIVVWHVAFSGVAPQADEGSAAHMWQILMAGQVPVIGFFAIKWLSTLRKQALLVLAVQLAAAVAAIFPVWWFRF